MSAASAALCSCASHDAGGGPPHCRGCCLCLPGSKRWKLYKPLAGFHLPSQSSPNLGAEGLGECVLDVTLRVRRGPCRFVRVWLRCGCVLGVLCSQAP